MDITLPHLSIITGYYGVGKTNLSLNLVRAAARKNEPVTLIDLDIINPYFRSSDYLQELQEQGVNLIAPTFARSALETPSLPAAMNGAFDAPGTVIIDVGGDDAGATTLARYRSDIQRRLDQMGRADSSSSSSDGGTQSAQDSSDPESPQNPQYALWYVVNRYRSNAATPQEAAVEAAGQLRDIETACKLKATGIINNTHLQADTTIDIVLEGLAFAQATAELTALPLIATTIPEQLLNAAQSTPELEALSDAGKLWPLELLVTTPWQNTAW